MANSNNKLKCFIAGSKALEKQRIEFRSVLSKMQNLWDITIEAKTFEDFPTTLSEEGRQSDYNNYIANESDIAVFIFDSHVGGITLKEFEVAHESFKSNKRPEILVYCKKEDESTNPDIKNLKEKLNQLRQYYIEYMDDNELSELFEKHINHFLVEHQHKDSNKLLGVFKKIGVVIIVWLIMVLMGGLIMYCIDSNMSQKEVINTISRNMDFDSSSNNYVYYLPDKIIKYSPKEKSITEIQRNTIGANANINLQNVEHVAFGATASVLLIELAQSRFMPKNGKMVVAYACAIVAAGIGVGVGCVIERMLFPPQFSGCVKDALLKTESWELSIQKYKPGLNYDF